MTWRIGNNGFEMTLSAALPGLIGAHIRPWCEGFLGSRGVRIADVEHWAIHPGGPRILSAAREALGLSEEAMRTSYGVLADHGNMSSATVLFLLQRLAMQAEKSSLCTAIGFGPGMMAEGMLLEK
jgi:predicted naringenin-chalcone synthase